MLAIYPFFPLLINQFINFILDVLLSFSRRDRCNLSPPLLIRHPQSVFPSLIFLYGSQFISRIGVSGGCDCICLSVLEGRVWGELGFGYLGPLPKEVKPRLILPLGLLHADPVCRHSGSTQTAMIGAHQGDCKPTLDVSTRFRLGLPPLGGQATGYPFQVSHRLHPQHQ